MLERGKNKGRGPPPSTRNILIELLKNYKEKQKSQKVNSYFLIGIIKKYNIRDTIIDHTQKRGQRVGYVSTIILIRVLCLEVSTLNP